MAANVVLSVVSGSMLEINDWELTIRRNSLYIYCTIDRVEPSVALICRRNCRNPAEPGTYLICNKNAYEWLIS